MSRARAAARRCFALVDTPPLLTGGDVSKVDLDASKHIIEFDKVAFSYMRDSPVLRSISFKIQRGMTVGIAGVTGGKNGRKATAKVAFADALV